MQVYYQREMFQGLISQVHVLKFEVVPDMGFKTFAPQGKAPGFEFPSNCGSLDGIYDKIVSQPLSMP